MTIDGCSIPKVKLRIELIKATGVLVTDSNV